MIGIFVGEAIQRLRHVGAPFKITHEGIETLSDNVGFKRRRVLPYTDSLGSLIDAEAVRKEVEYWWNKN